MTRGFLCALCAFVVSASYSSGADPTYWQDVRPVLRKHCTVCHSERKLSDPDVSAGLALDKPELIRKGGKVPVLVPKQPDKSLIVTLLTAKDKKRAMPLDADPLPPEDIALIRKWVEIGAPEGTKPADTGAAVVVAPTGPAKVRKLNVSFATKATLPGTKSAIEFGLPIGPLPPVAAVAFSPDGKFLAAGTYGRVTVWDLASAKPAKVLTNVLAAVNDLKFSPDGKLLAVAGGQPSARGDMRLFDTGTWNLVDSLGGHLDTVSGVAFSPDGKKLASASFDKTVRLWDVSDPKAAKVLHTFTGHSDFVYAVAFGPKGDWYATASKDHGCRVIDTATGKSKFTFSGTDKEILAVAVKPDGTEVVTSGLDTALFWWSLSTGERLRTSPGVGEATQEIAFDPKGTVAVACGASGRVLTYDPKDGKAAKATIAAGSSVFAVAIDGAAKRIATGAADGTVKLWDAATARLLATLWAGDGDWLTTTPEGFTAASDGVRAKAAWRAAGKPLSDAKLLAPLFNPAEVAKAMQGQKVGEVKW
jgi:WD40 repeat protein